MTARKWVALADSPLAGDLLTGDAWNPIRGPALALTGEGATLCGHCAALRLMERHPDRPASSRRLAGQEEARCACCGRSIFGPKVPLFG